jgi:hypothetical protein
MRQCLRRCACRARCADLRRDPRSPAKGDSEKNRSDFCKSHPGRNNVPRWPMDTNSLDSLDRVTDRYLPTLRMGCR